MSPADVLNLDLKTTGITRSREMCKNKDDDEDNESLEDKEIDVDPVEDNDDS